MAGKKKIEPSQLGRRRRRRRYQRLLFWLIVLVVVFLVVVGASHFAFARVSEVVIDGNTFSSTNNMILVAKKELQGDYYHLWPKDNILLFPKGDIKKKLLAGYPAIKNIQISRQNFQTLKVSVAERKPFGMWCRAENDCFFLDESGYIFYVAPNFSTDLYFIYEGSINDPKSPFGQQYLNPERFKEINNFLDQIKKLNVEAIKLAMTDQNDFQLTLKDGGEIRFKTDQPLDKTLSNLESVIDKNNVNETHINLSDLDYLDLRFGNKIFYKLKGGTTATSTL